MQYSELAPFEANEPVEVEQLELKLADLRDAFATIPDPRHRRNRQYSLPSLLLALSAAILCNHLSVSACAEWLADQTQEVKTALGFNQNRIPCQSTFHRAFKKLDPAQLELALTSYFSATRCDQPRQRASQQIAIDGKCQRGRLPFETQPGTPCHLLAAFCRELGQVLAQLAIQNKEAELSVAPQLLALLDWQGRVLTGDAIFCQRNLCQKVLQAGGDYLFVLKANQPTLQANVAQLFAPPSEAEQARQGFEAPVPIEIAQAKTVDKAHGRVEIREIKVSTELNQYADWPGLAQVFEIKREWERGGEWHKEIHFGITSLPASLIEPCKILDIRRGHWHIENRLHWVRDVVLGEDKSTLRLGGGPQVLGAIRNTVLNLLRGAGHHRISVRLRYNSRNPLAALALLGLAITH